MNIHFYGRTPMAARDQKDMTPEELVSFVEDLKRQWMSTIDALVDPLMFVKKDFTINKVNKAFARMTGKDVKDVIGKTCYKVFAKSKKPCPGCTLKDSIEHKEVTSFELDGTIHDKFYEVSSQPQFNRDGELVGAVHVYRDRTAAKRMEKQLLQQEKLASIGLLAGGVAHEINNPLGGILIFSQMLLKEMDKNSAHYQDVVEIEHATQRCKAIVESLLNFARQASSKDRSQVSLQESLRAAVKFATVGLTAKTTIQFHESYPEDEIFVLGDRNKFVQLFLNLVQNAIQAMPEGGDVFISIEQTEDDRVITKIRDTGDGISPKNLKKIFDPFFTTKDPGEGTGLGLALCYSIADEAGGTMRAESAKDQGATFIVELPATDKKETHKAS